MTFESSRLFQWFSFPPKITGPIGDLTQGLRDNRTKWSCVLGGQYGSCVLSQMQTSCPGSRMTPPPVWPHAAPGPFAPLVLFLEALGPKSSQDFTFRLCRPLHLLTVAAVQPMQRVLPPPPQLHAASLAQQKPLYFTCSSSSTSTGSLSCWALPGTRGPSDLCVPPTSLIATGSGNYKEASYVPNSILLLSTHYFIATKTPGDEIACWKVMQPVSGRDQIRGICLPFLYWIESSLRQEIYWFHLCRGIDTQYGYLTNVCWTNKWMAGWMNVSVISFLTN